MPHLSTEQLDPTVQKQIDAQLVRILLKSGPKLARELLTETEQLMLGKRLAALLMLADDFSYYRIGCTLGLSASTVKRRHGKLLNGDFPSIEKTAHSKRERMEFFKTLEIILRAGMPPIRGRGRWQGVDAILARMK